MQTVVVRGFMLFALAVLSLFVVVGVVVGSFAALLLLLPELICCLSLQFHAVAFAGQIGDGSNHHHRPNARGNNTAPIGAVLPLKNRTIGASVSVVVVTVVVIVMVSGVVIVVVAAVVVDVLLFGCEPRSGADRPF